MKYTELEKKLKAAGCYEVTRAGDHPKWFSPITGRTFKTGHHGAHEVSPLVIKNIKKASGVNL